MQNLTLFLDQLARLQYSPPDTFIPAHLSDRIRTLEDKLLKMKTILKVPLRSEPILSEYQDTLLRLWLDLFHTQHPVHTPRTPFIQL